MTLIINEIHLRNGLSDTFQIAAADRRITLGRKIETPRKKLFAIPHLGATVSYFGLAATNKNGKWLYFSDLIPDFIKKSHQTKTLQEFSNLLMQTLNKEVPIELRRGHISGFHLSGYTAAGLPEFWYFSNISGMDGPYYKKPVETYSFPTSDFLERDAKDKLSWDGVDLLSAQNRTMVYRNGDIRTHILASEQMDLFMGQILALPDFKNPKTLEEYAAYVKFKMEFIGKIYRAWADQKIIDKPIDVIIITKDGLKELNKNRWEFIKRQ
jgi:hypothetical protein